MRGTIEASLIFRNPKFSAPLSSLKNLSKVSFLHCTALIFFVRLFVLSFLFCRVREDLEERERERARDVSAGKKVTVVNIKFN